MELGLNGRTAIVTGGASSIGRAIVMALSAEGANVAIFDLDRNQAERVRQQASPERVSALQADVTEHAGVRPQ